MKSLEITRYLALYKKPARHKLTQVSSHIQNALFVFSTFLNSELVYSRVYDHLCTV
jgi:hypothetical protein